MQQRKLKKFNRRKVLVFKIANRNGYAAIANKNLTEGRSIPQAMARMAKALKRQGYDLAM